MSQGADADREFFQRELDGFLPDRVFDAHCHLWAADHANVAVPGVPATAGYEEYVRHMAVLHPGRETAALFVPFPNASADPSLANAWIAKQVKGRANCRGLYLVRPGDDAETVREDVRRLGLVGLKCYHTYAERKPTWEAEIPEYLPESLMRVAHEERWVITLHLVKSRGVADPGNIRWIRHYCTTYPNATLILAHSARGFQPAHNLEGLPHLADLGNLYFDTSANCEPMAHAAVLRTFGYQRLMYGSDFFVSHLRGRTLGAADSFVWLTENDPAWKQGHATVQPVLVGLEHLRSLKWACWGERLTDGQVEDVFHNNAVQLLGMSR